MPREWLQLEAFRGFKTHCREVATAQAASNKQGPAALSQPHDVRVRTHGELPDLLHPTHPSTCPATEQGTFGAASDLPPHGEVGGQTTQREGSLEREGPKELIPICKGGGGASMGKRCNGTAISCPSSILSDYLVSAKGRRTSDPRLCLVFSPILPTENLPPGWWGLNPD